MALNTFCGLLTLQVGTAIVAAVFFTIAGVIFAANIFDYYLNEESMPLNYILVILFVVWLVMAGVFIFISSYNEDRKLALFGLVAVIALICYWLILCCFSFIGSFSQVKRVCIQNRCPESFWIASVDWRIHRNDLHSSTSKPELYNPYFYPHYYGSKRRPSLFDEDVEHKYRLKVPDVTEARILIKNITSEVRNTIMDMERSTSKPRNTSHGNPLRGEDWSTSSLSEKKDRLNLVALENKLETGFFSRSTGNNIESVPQEIGNKFHLAAEYNVSSNEDSHYLGVPLLGAILLFVVNLIFLIFSAVVIWSWASELDWADYYVEDEHPDEVDDSFS